MIIFRYLCRELLTVTFAVSLILLMVLISGRFVKYLAQAVAGDLEPTVIFAIIGYRVPGFLELTLPLAFFLAVLLTLGRLYVENEMSVLRACGFSERQMLGYVMSVAVVIALLVGWLSLSVSPTGAQKYTSLLNAQKDKSSLDKLQPKKFYSLKEGEAVVYAEAVGEQAELGQVFLATQIGSEEARDRRLALTLAMTGGQKQSEDGSSRYLILNQGVRVEGVPGQAQFQLTRFDEYGTRVEEIKKAPKFEIDALATGQLFGSSDLSHQAALHWRMAIPVLVLLVSLMAVPLSRTNPRQGRFAKLLPAVLLYFTYLVLLNGVRGAVEAGKVQAVVGFSAVHGLFVLVALVLLYTGKLKKPKKRVASQGVQS